MGFSLSRLLTAQFYLWEQRGRGWHEFDEPIHLEPEFIPFFGQFLWTDARSEMDDGRRPRFFPKLQQSLGLFEKKSKFDSEERIFEDLDAGLKVTAYLNDDAFLIEEFQISLPKDAHIPISVYEDLLETLVSEGEFVGFEIIGANDRIIIQFITFSEKKEFFQSAIQAYLPEADILNYSYLAPLFEKEENFSVTELGLQDEFMRPLRVWNNLQPDPLSGIIATLDSLKIEELGVVQILFNKVLHPWAESMLRSVSDNKGGAFFVDDPLMLHLTREKVSDPLYSVVIRTIGQGIDKERSKFISQKLASNFSKFARQGSNRLIPLSSKYKDNFEEIVNRKSRRIGMILNSKELVSFVHHPDSSIFSPRLWQISLKTKSAPHGLSGNPFILGKNIHKGETKTVTLSTQQRLRHTHIIGSTGQGKSVLLLNMIVQDVTLGNGFAVLDPHGDLIDDIISQFPDNKINDVVLIDPSDTEFPMGLNLLTANSESERTLLSSDLVSLFKRFATSWGDQMSSILANAINAILDGKENGTLIDMRRFLVEPKFRIEVLKNVSDSYVRYYWQNEFPMLRKNIVAPILTRLDTFLRSRIVRNMMIQESKIDFAEVMNKKKILLVKLSQGLIGEENSYLLGTLILSKLHQVAQTRQNIPQSQRKPFFTYIDEFQHFITPSMNHILSGARKYGLGLVLAHQTLDQLATRDTDLLNSVLSNPFIRICFRVGDRDATRLENGFEYFDSTDLQNLKVGDAIVRVGKKDQDFNCSFSLLPKTDPREAKKRKQEIIEICRERYSNTKIEVEEYLDSSLGAIRGESPSLKSKSKPQFQTTKHSEISDIDQGADLDTDEDIQKKAEEFVEQEVEKERSKEHRRIQKYVKREAEKRNFRVVIEESVNDNTGKVDVALYLDELSIACEISVTNTVDYELKNIEKCIKANFSYVFMICNNESHLANIRKDAHASIDEDILAKLYFLPQDDFIVYVESIVSELEKPTEKRIGGYRVKVKYDSDEKVKRDHLLNKIFSRKNK